jgi:ABC-2 type transport system ATP-binding protein
MREPLSVKRLVGYLPDTVGFYDNMTAADNLHYTARLMGMRAAERKEKIAAALSRVGLAEVAEESRHVFARHAPAAGPRRNRDEGCARRHSR